MKQLDRIHKATRRSVVTPDNRKRGEKVTCRQYDTLHRDAVALAEHARLGRMAIAALASLPDDARLQALSSIRAYDGYMYLASVLDCNHVAVKWTAGLSDRVAL